MNVLYRASHDRPVIRIVDFESSYERARHSKGVFYSPPTTPGYSAPEVPPRHRTRVRTCSRWERCSTRRWPGTDGRTTAEVSARVEADPELDTELKNALLAAVDPIPDNRYGSVQEFQSALAAYLERIWPGRAW